VRAQDEEVLSLLWIPRATEYATCAAMNIIDPAKSSWPKLFTQ